ncbi:MAG TPA: VOC family protein [Thermomicrobiaceae bacterium]|nr:VOC family protein [Thermomicrobiaceae bacterium]
MPEEFVARVDHEGLHSAIRVRDLEKELHFYHEIIGLPIERIGGSPEHPGTVWLTGLQLVRNPNASTDPDGKFDHFGIAVDNLEEVCARLDGAGYVAETPLAARSRDEVGRALHMAFYRDPEGNKFELLRYDE